MRKLILILLSICSVSLIFSQDVVNPYQNYSLIDPLLNPAGGMPEYNIPSTTGGLDYDFYSSVDLDPDPTGTNFVIPAYVGEYMIIFVSHQSLPPFLRGL